MYLAGCAYAFENDEVSIYQIVCRKAGRSANDAAVVAPIHVREGALIAALGADGDSTAAGGEPAAVDSCAPTAETEDAGAALKQPDLFAATDLIDVTGTTRGPDATHAPAAKPPAPTARTKSRGVFPAPVAPELDALAARLPDAIHLGTSTWSFPGWRDIVYGDDYVSQAFPRWPQRLGAHPLLRCVSIDRSFYAPLSVADYARYADQVPAHFRFIVKAPSSVTDATVRGNNGVPAGDNPAFLDARIAIDEFVQPCIDGLGAKAGALVFQISPLPDAMIVDPAAFLERLSAFLARCRRLPGETCYAVELRDAVMLTPRFIRVLRDVERTLLRRHPCAHARSAAAGKGARIARRGRARTADRALEPA